MKGRILNKLCAISLAAVMLGGVGVTGAMPFVDTAVTVSAAEVYGDFEYTVSNGRATILKYKGKSTSVSVPASINGYPVVSIGSNTFYSNRTVVNVELPDSVTRIKSGAFYNCSELTSLTISNSVTSIEASTFYGCRRLASVTIPDSVKNIQDNAFYNCISLTSVTIPDSVTNIGAYAFYQCTGLTSVTIPDSVTSIGIKAFTGCVGLEDSQKLLISDGLLFGYNGTASTVIIPDSVTRIGASVFQFRTKLTSVTIPDSVTSIGNEAFYHCIGLSSVTIPDSVTSIGSNAFSGCTALSSVTIPDSVTSIGTSAFYGCTRLPSVTIPDSVTSIGKSAFWGCTHLTSVTIPDSVTGIGDSAFSGCTALSSVTIPGSVKNIGNDTFYGCSNITSVTLLSGVESIGYHAFARLDSLNKIFVPKTVHSIDTYALSSSNSSLVVRCDQKSYARSWAEKNGWNYEDNTGDPLINYASIDKDVYAPNEMFVVTCDAEAGTAPYLYSMIYRKAGTTAWTIAHPYSEQTRLPLTLTDPGYYELQVNVADDAGEIARKKFTVRIAYTLTLDAAVDTQIIRYNHPVNITCESAGGLGEHQYAVYTKKQGDTDWTMLSDYSPETAYVFTPETAGAYTIRVDVRDEDHVVTSKEISVTAVGDSSVKASVSADFIRLGNTVELTYAAQGGFDQYEYAVSVKRQEENEWTLLSDYTTEKKLSFTPENVGIYSFRVDARDADGVIVTNEEATFEVGQNLTNTSVLSAERMILGSKVKVRCFAEGGSGDYQYAVFYKKSSARVWTRASAYSSKNIVILTPKAAVSYDIRVDVKDTEGTVVSRQMKLTVAKELENTSKLSAESITFGEKVKVRCFATGGMGDYQYAVYSKKSTSENWSRLRDYDASNIIVMTPKAAVTYDIRVDVRDAAGKVVSKILTLNVTKSSES